jgi:hypothetical protein
MTMSNEPNQPSDDQFDPEAGFDPDIEGGFDPEPGFEPGIDGGAEGDGEGDVDVEAELDGDAVARPQQVTRRRVTC